MPSPLLKIPKSPIERAQFAEALQYCWPLHRRPEQTPPPGDWLTWIYLAGRGAGKTRTAAETVRDDIESRRRMRWYFIGPTATDIRDVMVEGESGIMAIYPEGKAPRYEPSKMRITWPNGAVAYLRSAEKPDRLRGPQAEGIWAEELCAWKYPDEAWDMAMFGLRKGRDPRILVSTTPRPIKLLRELLKRDSTVVTRGTTYDNRANLSEKYFKDVLTAYEGTRLGRQELMAEILEDNPDALFRRQWIDDGRVKEVPCDLATIVVAIDPSTTPDGDEAGIVVAGKGVDGECYVLEDGSRQGSPAEWAKAAVALYDKYDADRITAERNNGGHMIAVTIGTVRKRLPVKLVWASRGKITRAEPVAALYEQGHVHHGGNFPKLEDEQCDWTQGDPLSPNRLDALVWAISDLNKINEPQKISTVRRF